MRKSNYEAYSTRYTYLTSLGLYFVWICNLFY